MNNNPDKKFYTGVGSSSETPENVSHAMKVIAATLASKGYWLRSGCAQGADTAFENGVKEIIHDHTTIVDRSHQCELYIPWNGFENKFKDGSAIFCPTDFQNYDEASKIASKIHPAWDRLSCGGRKLHTRNVYQVLGKDLRSPSEFLICWAQPTVNGVKGGTNTAYQIAKAYGIPIYNLYYPWEAIGMFALL